MLNIVVCVKIIIDPEMPLSAFSIDKENRTPVPPSGIPPVLSTFDENALEAALKIKDSQPDSKVTILSLGKVISKAVMQKMIALGVDEAIALEDPAFENLDPYNCAGALSKAIAKIGGFHLVFTGRQGADWDAGLTWAGIADFFDLPSITLARQATVNDGKLIIERCVADGVEVLECEPPALVTFGNEAGELRNVSLKALMLAKKHPIIKWTASDIGFERESIIELTDLYSPDFGGVNCVFMPGGTDEEKGRNLARLCIEAGLLAQ